MSLAGRYGNEKHPGGGKGTFTCEHYSPLPGGKRCKHYIDNGACAREDEFMCVEWMKANHPDSPAAREASAQPPRTDLFGGPAADAPKPCAASTPAEPENLEMKAKPAPGRTEDVPLVRNVTDEEIASFRALGASVCIRTEHVGDVWLVPEYTDHKDRFELRIDHAATLTAICAAFPGARVTSIEPDSEAPKPLEADVGAESPPLDLASEVFDSDPPEEPDVPAACHTSPDSGRGDTEVE